MKSRIMNEPRAQMLLYGFGTDELEKLRSCAKPLKLETKVLPESCINEKVGDILSQPFNVGVPTECGRKCVIFSCIDGGRLSKALDSMRALGLNIPLKAVVTDSNRKMTLSELMDELEKEHLKLHPQAVPAPTRQAVPAASRGEVQ